MKNSIKFFVVLLILLIFGISCAHAANETDTSSLDESSSESTVTVPDTEVNKVITKTDTTDKKVKTGYNEITSYKELSDELTDLEMEKTLHLKKGTYKVTSPIKMYDRGPTRKVVIYGNGAVIDGSSSKAFLTIFSNNDVTINDLVIQNTKGTNGAGGIVVGRKSTLTLNNCNFTNDVSAAIGGAITNSGSATITNCVFKSNTADNGGAIWSTGEHGGFLTIDNCKFINNKANKANNYDKKAVVYYITGKNVKVTNNLFENNNGRAIHAFKANSLVSGNTFKNIVLKAPTQTIRGAVIDNYESNINIQNNIFDNINIAAKSVKGGLLYNEIGTSTFEDNKITNLKVSSTEKTDSLNGGILFNRNSSLTVAYNTISNTNNGYKVHGGELYNNMGKLYVYTNTFNPKNTASNDIKGGALYNDPQGLLTHGGNNFNGIQNNGKVNGREIFNYGKVVQATPPKKATKITLNKVSGTLGDTVSIAATVKDTTGLAVNDGSIVFKINGNAVTVKTQKNGVFTYKYKTKKVGTNNVIASFAATNKYKASSAKATFNVAKKVSKLTVTKVAQKTYNDKVTITGKLVDKSGVAVKYAAVKVKLNTKTVTVKTNAKGVYSYKVTVNKVGKNDVTISFAGNGNYKASTVKTTFTVAKKATKLTFTKVAEKTVGDQVTLTGKLTDASGVVIKNANIRLRVNSNVQTIKTNTNGVYTLKVTANKVGTNNVVVYYPATTNYKGVEYKTTFEVVEPAD